APAGVRIEIATIQGIPLYDGDVESERGIPAPVSLLKDAIALADALLLVTPEYNHTIPGPLKNAIDWLTRPPDDIERVFAGKPVAVMGASPGGFGTVLSQNAWLPILRTLGTKPWFGQKLLVSRAASVFDQSGNIVDDKLRERLERFIRGFAEFAASENRQAVR